MAADDIFGLFSPDDAVMWGKLKEALIKADPGELMKDYSELFTINAPRKVCITN